MPTDTVKGMPRPATKDQADAGGQASTAPGSDANVMTTTDGRRLDTP